MKNKGKIAICMQTGLDFLKEGTILSEKDHQGVTSIQFGIENIQHWGPHMFCLKDDMLEELGEIKKGDVKYFIWDNKVYEVEIMYLVKANQERFQHPDEDRFIAKCNPKYFKSRYISDQSISKLINTKAEAVKESTDLEIKELEHEIKWRKKRINELKPPPDLNGLKIELSQLLAKKRNELRTHLRTQPFQQNAEVSDCPAWAIQVFAEFIQKC